jgi:hypothetical protein
MVAHFGTTFQTNIVCVEVLHMVFFEANYTSTQANYAPNGVGAVLASGVDISPLSHGTAFLNPAL